MATVYLNGVQIYDNESVFIPNRLSVGPGVQTGAAHVLREDGYALFASGHCGFTPAGSLFLGNDSFSPVDSLVPLQTHFLKVHDYRGNEYLIPAFLVPDLFTDEDDNHFTSEDGQPYALE
jgi:hypothetical protein